MDIVAPALIPNLRECAILLDVDGTILDLAATPREVWVPPSLRRDMTRLSERTGGAVALVSGRSLNDLDLLFSPLQLPAIGGHGAEFRPHIGGERDLRRTVPLDASLKLGAAGVENGEFGQMLRQYRDRTLKDLFIVSGVGMLADSEVAELKGKADGHEDFKVDGMFGRVSTQPPVVVVGARAPGIKCQRCWCYYDDGGDPELCPRCREVVRAPKQ